MRLSNSKEEFMSGPFSNIPPIHHVIPKEAAYIAVSRGEYYLQRETDPAIRRRLKGLIADALEPSSRFSVSAVEQLMRWGKL
jgi:hypothetical protein